MVYSDVEKFGLIGCIPAPNGKNGEYPKQNKKIRTEVCNKILNNRPFCQFAMKEKNVPYINDILAHLVAWVITCNEAYYYYKNAVDSVKA